MTLDHNFVQSFIHSFLLRFARLAVPDPHFQIVRSPSSADRPALWYLSANRPPFPPARGLLPALALPCPALPCLPSPPSHPLGCRARLPRRRQLTRETTSEMMTVSYRQGAKPGANLLWDAYIIKNSPYVLYLCTVRACSVTHITNTVCTTPAPFQKVSSFILPNLLSQSAAGPQGRETREEREYYRKAEMNEFNRPPPPPLKKTNP